MPKFNLKPHPPKATKKPVTTEQLGRRRTDDYHWMKDENWQAVMRDPSLLDSDIRSHLEIENAYTEEVLSDLKPLSAEIFEEMKGRLEAEDSDVPAPDGTYAYYHRFRKGDQHGLYARIPIDPETKETNGDEEIILDADKLAGDKKGFFNIGTVTHSPDHSRYAYTLDDKGSENFEIFVGEVSQAATSSGILTSTGNVEWAADSATLFWVERDENQRPASVHAKHLDKTIFTRSIRKATLVFLCLLVKATRVNSYK